VDRAQLERERQERIRLQEKLNALSAEIEAAKKKSEPGSAIDPATRDHVASLEESITTLRAELKERDDRLLAMSLKVDRPPAVQKPFTRRLTVPTIVLGALAVGAVGTGVGFGVDARNNKMRFMSTPYPAPAAGYARNGTRSQIVADSCFGGAIALAATALLVFVFQGPPEEPSP
jgi:hypothetical protein